MHFAYDTLKEFLPQLGIDVQTREKTGDKEQRSLELSFDDVIKAYTYLLETRYPSPKDQRNLFYQLKLSLHARFPELIDSSAKGE